MSRARKLSDTVALTAHINEARDIEFMESLLGMRIIPVRYDTKEELEERIRETMARGVRVFVGGGGTARIVSRLGGQIFLDEPQPVNIRNAVSRAITIAENMRMEQTNRSNIQAMLHYSKEGVICLSAQRDIVSTMRRRSSCCAWRPRMSLPASSRRSFSMKCWNTLPRS